MSTLLHDKRALEAKLGCPVEFRRGCFRDDETRAVEVRATEPMEWDSSSGEHSSRWLGHGDDHIDAIADCYETLRVRERVQSRVDAVDAHCDRVRGLA